MLEDSPYKPPATCESSGESGQEPNTTLATWAVVFAVVLSFTPIGADMLHAVASSNSVVLFVAVVSLFLIVMVTPLILLYRNFGTAGLLAAPKRVTLTTLIVVRAASTMTTGVSRPSKT